MGKIIAVKVRKEIYEKFEEKVREEGKTKSQVLRELILKYLGLPVENPHTEIKKLKEKIEELEKRIEKLEKQLSKSTTLGAYMRKR